MLSVQYGDSCFSIGVAKAFDIISVGCGKNFVTYNSRLMYLNHGTSNHQVWPIGHQLKSNQLYYLNSFGTLVHVPLDDPSIKRTLFSCNSSHNLSRIAMNNDYLAVSNAEGYPLLVYSFGLKTSNICMESGYAH